MTRAISAIATLTTLAHAAASWGVMRSRYQGESRCSGKRTLHLPGQRWTQVVAVPLAELGWTVVRVLEHEVLDGTAFERVVSALGPPKSRARTAPQRSEERTAGPAPAQPAP